MRSKIILIAAALVGCSALPAGAQISVDMNAITCRDYLGYSPANQQFVRSWLSGYYNAAGNSNVLDYARFQKNTAKVTAFCKKNRNATLPTAIQRSAS